MIRNVDKIQPTIGDLVLALTDARFEVCAEKRDAYFLVTLALKHLLGEHGEIKPHTSVPS